MHSKNIGIIGSGMVGRALAMGTAKAARAIEPLAMLWCIPGFRENRWTHAFKLLRIH